jgi:hypothetical protein
MFVLLKIFNLCFTPTVTIFSIYYITENGIQSTSFLKYFLVQISLTHNCLQFLLKIFIIPLQNKILMYKTLYSYDRYLYMECLGTDCHELTRTPESGI